MRRVAAPRRQGEAGFTLLELLVSLTLLLVVMGGVYGLLIQNARINRAQQMAVEAQDNARTCLNMIVQVLRSAGWDPSDSGLAAVQLDPDLADSISLITVLADLNFDGNTGGPDEAVTIRHTGNQIEWKRSSAVGEPWVILADGITNDADGDGTIEPMFVPDSTTDPTRITVVITAAAPLADPRTGQFFRYTVSSDVVLRKEL